MSDRENLQRDLALERNENKVQNTVKLYDGILHDELVLPKRMVLHYGETRELSFRLEPEDLEHFFEHPDGDETLHVPPRGKALEHLRENLHEK
jgi:hypothetical protein